MRKAIRWVDKLNQVRMVENNQIINIFHFSYTEERFLLVTRFQKRMAPYACVFVFMVLPALVHPVGVFPTVSVFAMMSKIPEELLQLISEWYPESNQEFIANNSIAMEQQFVLLNNRSISSVFHWNFATTQLQNRSQIIDLSDNQIKRVSDQVTCFGVVAALALRNNQIESVDLRRTCMINGVLHLNQNAISSESFRLNQVLLPQELIFLTLSDNPICHLSDYVFPKMTFIHLMNCHILLLQNVVFEAEAVYLDKNPGLILQNVTFVGTNYLSFMDCNISEEQFLTFQVSWYSDTSTQLKVVFGRDSTLTYKFIDDEHEEVQSSELQQKLDEPASNQMKWACSLQ